MEIIILLIPVLIILLPFSAFASQIIGKHKKMTRSRIFTTVSSVVACFVLACVTIVVYFAVDDGYDVRDGRLILLAIVVFAFNLLYIWLQREKPNRNIWRKWVNTFILIGGVSIVSIFAYSYLFSQTETEPDGWYDDLEGYMSQDEKNYRYLNVEFYNDFGFTIPTFDVISKKHWRENGSSGVVIEIKTHQPVTRQFLRDQAQKKYKEDGLQYKFENGVYSFSYLDTYYGNLHVYKITHNNNYSLTLTIDHPYNLCE